MLRDELVGVYAGGSYALGAHEPGRSDLDVAVVVSTAPSRATKDELVEALRHERLPCPARGLELVVYRLDLVRAASPRADFELNLNTGAEMAFRADREPGAEQHWFPIDRSILREHGIALRGPPAAGIFGALPRPALLALVAGAVRWHAGGAARDDDAVLNACRAWRFAEEGVWSTKPEAGSWALERGSPSVVGEALATRTADGPLDRTAVRSFLDDVAERVELAAQSA